VGQRKCLVAVGLMRGSYRAYFNSRFIARLYRACSQSALALPKSFGTFCCGMPEGAIASGVQIMNLPIMPESITAARALAGRVSLVTGSTSGIGLGIARALAAVGSEIVLNGFGTPENIAEAQAQIAAEFNVRVLHLPADMSRPASIREMIETTLASFGRLDVLVNNAGIQHVAPLQEFPPEKWDAILAINLSSAFHTSRLVLPSMFDHKWGRIISRRHMDWSARRSSPPMLRPNTAYLDLPR
jgi:short chain dehydrogenase